MINCYNDTLSCLTDLHAPLRTKIVIDRPRLLWFNAGIHAAIRARRCAERTWCRTGRPEHLAVFKKAKNYASLLLNDARTKYLSDFILDNSHDQGKLFRATKSLLSRPQTLRVPDHCNVRTQANDIGEYFDQKVQGIHQMLFDDTANPYPLVADTTECTTSFDSFKELSLENGRALITRNSKKSCQLDPMPTSLVVQCLDELTPVFTSIINSSLQSGCFSTQWKEALVNPLLKKDGLEQIKKNLRPVSNLSYLSKLTETAAAIQLQDHMHEHGLYPTNMSSYRKHHSTETALLRVRNDILLNMND